MPAFSDSPTYLGYLERKERAEALETLRPVAFCGGGKILGIS